jgi:hypothetical protein
VGTGSSAGRGIKVLLQKIGVFGLFFFFLASFSGNVFGGQVCEIQLVDGGVILGEIISHNDDNYVVRSNSLGVLKVKESEIQVIRFGSHPAHGSKKKEIVDDPPKGASPEIESLQESMMNDKDVMEKVMHLQNDPQMQALLKDPEFMKAINSGDISTLMANPKFRELLNNPEIKEIQKEVLKP